MGASTTKAPPVGWRMVKLSDVCEIQLGKMLSPKSKGGAHPKPYLRNANVQWNRFALDHIATMDFSEREKDKFELKKGDLLVCEGGEPGRAAVWQGEIKTCFYQKALLRLRPINSAIDPHFMLYRLWLGANNSEFADSQTKTTIAHLPAVRLAEFSISLPPLAEQRRIAAILQAQMATVEKARAAAERQIGEAIALANALIRESVSCCKTKAVPLREALVEIKAGVGPTWKKYPVLGATRAGLALAREPVGKQPERYKLVDPQTVFYNPMRILLGSIALVDDGDQAGITSPDYVAVKGRPGLLDTRWFYYWFRSHAGAALVMSLSRGAVRERMLFTRLAEGVVQLPDFSVQQKASACLAAIPAIQKAAGAQLADLEKLPAALLRQAFAGAM